MRAPRLLFALTALAVALTLSGTAQAFEPTKPDSAAPAGSRPDWLPSETWVMQRWVPFDEDELAKSLHLTFPEVWHRLSAGQTLRRIAIEQHVSVRRLPGRVLASRRGSVSAAKYRVLRQRVQRMLTQQHLAEHMLGHVLHQWAVTRNTDWVFGVPQTTFQKLYHVQHRTLGSIAVTGGLTTAQARSRALRAASAAGARGVRSEDMSAKENRLVRARDRQYADRWLGLNGAAAPTVTAAKTASAGAGMLLCRLV